MKPDLCMQTVFARYQKSQSFKIKVANVTTQKGSIDCGLYAIPMVATITYRENPIDNIFNQQDIMIDLKKCFAKGILDIFYMHKGELPEDLYLKNIC